LNQVDEISARAREIADEERKPSVNKEDLNFPLANEIRARPRHVDVDANVVVVAKTEAPVELAKIRGSSAPRETTPKPVSSNPSTGPAVRPKTNNASMQKQPSPRPRRSAGPSSSTSSAQIPPEKDEVRVLSDIEDVALRPSRDSFDHHRRTRQISITSRQEEEDSSSSESSHSSTWSPTGRRRRNFDDWPIRSGDDSFKTKSGGGGGRRHRDSDTTSAGGGGGGGTAGGRGAGVASNVGGASRGRGGQSAASSSRGRITTNPPSSASGGGAGGLPPPYPQQQPPIASAVNEQIAVALLRIQQDVSTLNARINTLETLFWSSSNGGSGAPPGIAASAVHGVGGGHTASGDLGLTPPSPASAMKPIATTILNWLFPGFSLRSVVFLLLWPILAKGAYMIVKALISLALMKRRRFIDGHDDLPPL